MKERRRIWMLITMGRNKRIRKREQEERSWYNMLKSCVTLMVQSATLLKLHERDHQPGYGHMRWTHELLSELEDAEVLVGGIGMGDIEDPFVEEDQDPPPVNMEVAPMFFRKPIGWIPSLLDVVSVNLKLNLCSVFKGRSLSVLTTVLFVD